jgi:hypothetical protein
MVAIVILGKNGKYCADEFGLRGAGARPSWRDWHRGVNGWGPEAGVRFCLKLQRLSTKKREDRANSRKVAAVAWISGLGGECGGICGATQGLYHHVLGQ